MPTTRTAELAARALTYGPAGLTRPDSDRWDGPPGRRAYERTVRLGRGEECWSAASAAVLAWGVKTGSGFTVEPAVPSGGAVRVGERFWLVARLGPVRVREPVEVVAVVDRDDRRGFAYGTLDGHPVSGEEAFVVHRGPDGAVHLTLRSVTARGRGRWAAAFPAALVAQHGYRRRYLRALAERARG
jgi:uncharacterized protein (UPF0548 family)